MIAEMGYVSLNKQFIDGSKIESVISNIESAIKKDNCEKNPGLKEVNSEELQAKIEQLKQNLEV
ncbi:MAG: hypothetical protein JXA16_08970 [Bacteroidales bacterium]|nr:hypothetical protein [Bacteroidales bacterium]